MKITIEVQCGSPFQKKCLDDILELILKVLNEGKANFEKWHKKNKFEIFVEED